MSISADPEETTSVTDTTVLFNRLSLLQTGPQEITAIWPKTEPFLLSILPEGGTAQTVVTAEQVNCGNTPCLYHSFNNLTIGTVYYITVKAGDTTYSKSIRCNDLTGKLVTPLLYTVIPPSELSNSKTSLFCLWRSPSSYTHFRIEYSKTLDFEDIKSQYSMRRAYSLLENLEEDTSYYIRVRCEPSTGSVLSSDYSNTVKYSTKNVAEILDTTCMADTSYQYAVGAHGIGGLTQKISRAVKTPSIDNENAIYIDNSCLSCSNYRYIVRFPSLTAAKSAYTVTYCAGYVLDITLEADRSLFTIRDNGEPVLSVEGPPLSDSDIINKLYTTSANETEIYFDLQDDLNPFATITTNNTLDTFSISQAKINLLDYSESSITGKLLGNPLAEPLDTPENVGIQRIGSSMILVNWNPVQYATNYIVRLTTIESSEEVTTEYTTKGTSIYLSDLDKSTSYDISVKAEKYKYTSSLFSPPVTVETDAGFINFNVKEASQLYIDLDWDDTDLNVKLLRANSYNGTYVEIATNFTQSDYRDSTVSSNTEYFYRLENEDDITQNDVVYARTGSNIPDSPKGLTAIGLLYAVEVSWGTVDNAQSYKLIRAINGSTSYTEVYQGVGLGFTDLDCQAGVLYSYKIYAIGYDGNSLSTETASAYIRLAKVNNLAVQANASSIDLIWSSSLQANQYEIYRKKSEEANFTLLSTVETLHYSDKSLENNILYTYYIIAKNNNSLSDISDTVSAVIGLDPPTNLTVTEGQVVTLSWDTHPAANQFIVYSAITAYGPFLELAIVNGVNSYIDINGIENETKYYRIKCKRSTQDFISDYSNLAYGTFQPITTYYYIGGETGSFLAAEDWSATSGGTALISSPQIKTNKEFVIEGTNDVTISDFSSSISNKPILTFHVDCTIITASNILLSSCSADDVNVRFSVSSDNNISIEIP